MRKTNTAVWLTIGIVLLGILACEYTDYPDPIWDESTYPRTGP